MTWPPALMESTGGHAEGADTRTRGPAACGVSKATKGKHAGLVKEGKEYRTANGSEGNSSDWGTKDG